MAKRERKDTIPVDDLRHAWHVLMAFFRNRKLGSEYPSLHELGPHETGAIDAIAEHDGVILREVGQVLCVPKSTLTSIIDRLERGGYVKRVLSERDRRSFALELTPLGKKVYAEHVAFESATWREALGALRDDDERATFVEMLGRMVAHIESRHPLEE